MKNVIKLSKANYKKYIPIDIAAISLAEPGAMGERGGIIIMSTKNELFHLNYIRDEGTNDVLDLICPILFECEILLFAEKTPPGWFSKYLGFGNHLIVREYLQCQFDEKANKLEDGKILYNEWINIISSIIEEKSNANT